MLGEANIHFAYREFQQAVAMLLEVVRLAPGMPHPYQTLGLIYEEMGRPLKALKLFMMRRTSPAAVTRSSGGSSRRSASSTANCSRRATVSQS